ncbi:hypothetical protein IU443_15645 [Nocardia farcinica]|uniref:hypothetical protein n=1 Tax=Nocardia farcinica TaxID=37329 RepID=UPI0009CAFCF5|nr:hypothetical protein [Nocardia farcinica]SLJ81746.1 Uncharacterised protein [Mycobacteroides abscessus subsp. abscessus]MBF6233457.1 hypothetical protein [Nocardia farcinica]MBF6250972.1 hypothetical protein [Nocardia farcinica]MBF6259229.1 hypothetical protein [Nocardia farcinica]MBF6264093.1 hypothetical protein [Nocardia farcinica]
MKTVGDRWLVSVNPGGKRAGTVAGLLAGHVAQGEDALIDTGMYAAAQKLVT